MLPPVTPTPTVTPTPAFTPTPTSTPSGTPAFGHAEFVYDGDGKRVRSALTTGLGTTTTYFVGSHYEVTGTTVTKYYYAGSQRIAMRQGGNLYYLLSDHLGSTSLTTNSSGSVISELRYSAWGGVRYSSGSAPTDYTFTAQYSNMPDFGLMYYGTRWYDPYLNHFTQPDAIVPDPYNPQDWDRFSYVRNNPIRYTDPSGHCIDACVIEVFAIATVVTLIAAYVYTTPEIQDLSDQFAENFSANLENVIERVGRVFSEENQPLEEGENVGEVPAVDPSDILMPDGKPIGKSGRQGEKIREVDEGEISEIWEDLSEIGKEIDYPSYKGDVLELEDGTIVGLRDSAQHGPTIDILKGKLPYDKIHGPWTPPSR